MLTKDRVTGGAAFSPKTSPEEVKLLPRAYRLFFGEDFFITYGRADAGSYAAALANRKRPANPS